MNSDTSLCGDNTVKNMKFNVTEMSSHMWDIVYSMRLYASTHLYSVLMGADDSSCVVVVVIIMVAFAKMNGLIVRLCDGLCLV